MPFSHGTHNGYVAVPPGHPCHGVSYFDEPVSGLEVHGGITFSEPVIYPEKIHGIEINPEAVGKRNEVLGKAEYITDKKDIPDDWWIFGFDTCHYGDDSENWCMERVVDETMKLKDELEKLTGDDIGGK